jgi:hypothetical protein
MLSKFYMELRELRDLHKRILKIWLYFQVGWTLYCGPPESSAKMKKNIEKYKGGCQQCFKGG